MIDQAVETIKQYFNLIKVDVNKLPVKVEFEDSSRIDMEISGDNLLVIYSPFEQERGFQQIANVYLKAIYFTNQRNFTIKLGVHSGDNMCFLCAIDLNDLTVPLLTDVVDNFLSIRKTLS